MKIAASILSWLGGIAGLIIDAYNLYQGYFEFSTTTTNRYGQVVTETVLIPIPDWVWIVFGVFAILRIGLLIYREISVYRGNKVLCGVLTLIFASVIGGILTLCIPQEQLYGYTNIIKKHKSSSTGGTLPSDSKYSLHSNSNSSNPTNNDAQEEIKQEPEFIYVKPDENNPLVVGMEVRVDRSFFDATSVQRVEEDDDCKIVSIDGGAIIIDVDKSYTHFQVETYRENILVKTKNPNYVSKELDKFDELKKYKELLDLKIITQEEFEEKKKELLG